MPELFQEWPTVECFGFHLTVRIRIPPIASAETFLLLIEMAPNDGERGAGQLMVNVLDCYRLACSRSVFLNRPCFATGPPIT
jgi:hypothetical protein